MLVSYGQARAPRAPGLNAEDRAMRWRHTEKRYGTLSIALHWIMLVLLIAVVAFMELRGIFPKGSAPREAMKALHYAAGLLVLALAFLRIAALCAGRPPAIAPLPPGWQRMLAGLVKGGLYLIMLGMPLAGWALLGADGEPFALFGWPLPALAGPDQALADKLEEIHETGASIAYFLVGVHVIAALYHHYIVGDNTLRRMLPRAGEDA